MRRALLLIPVAVAMIVAGCTKWEVTGFSSSDDAINFGTYATRYTKAAITDDNTLQQANFGVMAYYTKQQSWSEAQNPLPDYMYNQRIVPQGTGWHYNPMKYWPNRNGDMISFFAYAPYEEQGDKQNNITLSGNLVTGAPYIDFEAKPLAADQVDLVAAEAVNRTKSTEKVRFDFKHILSRIGFGARKGLGIDPAQTTLTVNRVIVGYDGGQVDRTARYTFSPTGGSWGYVPERTQFGAADADVSAGNVAAAGGYVLRDEYDTNTGTYGWQRINADDGFLMMIPQTVGWGDMYVDVEFTVRTVDSSLPDGVSVVTNFRRVHLPSVEWQQGKAYTYVMVITPLAIVFDVVDVDEWVSDTNPEQERDVE